ncbi:MAG: hydrogenase maturation protease [Dactylosporangium sp.]|nr:hydrogenase maturation protease [Dactylosporangium sp.]NNJ62215.1 hydrogenase maturation protease [Dactylosporangium sp.]
MSSDAHCPGDVVVIGIGNPFRRDDGVGVAVAARLSAQRLPGVRFAVSDGEAAGLIELWEGARLAVVIDALCTEPSTPGRIHRRSVGDARDTDFGEAVELARILGRLPRRLVLFAVEAKDMGFGPGLTPAVAAAAGRVAAEIANQVAIAA